MSGWQRKVLALPKFNPFFFCKGSLKPVISCIVEGLIITVLKRQIFSFNMTVFAEYIEIGKKDVREPQQFLANVRV